MMETPLESELQISPGDIVEAKIVAVNNAVLIALAGRGVRLTVRRRHYALGPEDAWSSESLVGKIMRFVVRKQRPAMKTGKNRVETEAWSAARVDIDTQESIARWIGLSITPIIKTVHGPQKVPHNFSAYSAEINKKVTVWELHDETVHACGDAVRCEIVLTTVRRGSIQSGVRVHAVSGTDDEIRAAKALLAKVGGRDFLNELYDRRRAQLKIIKARNQKIASRGASRSVPLSGKRSAGEVRNDQFMALAALLSTSD